MRTASSTEAALYESEPDRGVAVRDAALGALEQDILLAVAYADVFDFPLTYDELFGRIVRCPVDRRSVMRCVRRMAGNILCDTGEFVCLSGREHIVALRSVRTRRAAPVWEAARRYARWLRSIPFVRSVAVSGSLAVGNVSGTSDVDFFCITSTNRLWIARLFLVPISKATRHFPRLFGSYLCPNYLVDQESLTVPDQNLFTAHEVMQAVPLWGFDVHSQFLDANRWATAMLPNAQAGKPAASEPSEPLRPLLTRLFEGCLSGRIGDRLNITLYTLFTFAYRLRARRRGWSWEKLAAAYQTGRYTVPEGGYTAVVASHFRRRVRAAVGDRISLDAIDAVMPAAKPTESVYDWKGLFEAEYGSAE